jgi:iron complex outermembrane recepter protein
MRPPIPFLFLVACAYLPAAQAQTSVSEQDYFADMPVVLSVSRLPQRLDETPGAVTILDRDFIRQTGARDVADLLRLVPGFQSSASFEADAPQASYHGVFGNYSARIQVLVDGRSVYSTYFFGAVSLG